MNNKTLIIANKPNTSKQFKNWMMQQIPQLQLTGKSGMNQEGLMMLQQKQSQFIFLNLKDLSVDGFLQLQQMENTACSIFFSNQITSNSPGLKLKVDGIIKYIPYYKIVRLEACSNYTQFYLSNSIKPVLTSKTLKYYVEQLGEDAFVRPHQSHLVNRSFVQRVVLKPKPCLILKEGCKIGISRRRIGMFKNWDAK